MGQSENVAVSSSESQQGATGIITHHVREGEESVYENWLREIGAACKSYPGHLDIQIIRPIPGLTRVYTIVIRFDTPQHLHHWVRSDDRKAFIKKVQPILSKEDSVFIRSGLDFWFTPEGAKAKLPTRWKQFLVTWSAIYPVSGLRSL